MSVRVVSRRSLGSTSSSRLIERRPIVGSSEKHEEEITHCVFMGRRVVLPGEEITPLSGFLRGHGTHMCGAESMAASVSGIVERVDRLISVRPLHGRYSGSIGDVVIGRVTEVENKRWKVDIQGRQDAVLPLSAVNLPSGEQRRKTEDDNLQMREFLGENDLIAAEVQQFFHDGGLSLQTRSSRYGKLAKGLLVSVPPCLIRRTRLHFHSFPCGVDMILGVNGYIWLSHQKNRKDVVSAESPAGAASDDQITREERLQVCRVANAIRALWSCGLQISVTTVGSVYENSLHLPVKEMLDPKVASQITALSS